MDLFSIKMLDSVVLGLTKFHLKNKLSKTAKKLKKLRASYFLVLLQTGLFDFIKSQI